MQLQEIPKSVFRLEPPPLWYVTNGELTVGPVVTGLLMKGVEYGRVPEYCHVRTYHGDWRTLHSVREISALNSKVSKAPTADQLGCRTLHIDGLLGLKDRGGRLEAHAEHNLLAVADAALRASAAIGRSADAALA